MSLSIKNAQPFSLWALTTRLWDAAHGAQKRMARQVSLQRELDRMDAHMLSDIGISRAQLTFEIDHDR